MKTDFGGESAFEVSPDERSDVQSVGDHTDLYISNSSSASSRPQTVDGVLTQSPGDNSSGRVPQKQSEGYVPRTRQPRSEGRFSLEAHTADRGSSDGGGTDAGAVTAAIHAGKRPRLS